MFSDVFDASIRIGFHALHIAERNLINTHNYIVTRLTSKELQLILCLYNAGGKLVSQKDILNNIWKYSEKAQSNTVKNHICRIRKKMAADPDIGHLLRTEPGGYRLIKEKPLSVSSCE